MVDIVCNSNYYKSKIIFTNSKNSKNDVYSKLLKDIQEQFEAHGHEVLFNVEEVRNKFKKLTNECKKVALTIKSITGVDRFREKKNYGGKTEEIGK